MKSKLKKFHIRRKIIHVLAGLCFIILIRRFDIRKFLVISIIATYVFSVYVKSARPKFFIKLLKLFEKPHDIISFPARGAFFYLLGIFVVVEFFNKNIASASILILSLGDPMAHIIGVSYGRKRLLINKRKLLEGTLAGIFVGTLAASFFVSVPIAFFGSVFGMMAEAIELKYLELDDNLSIPIAAALIMQLLSGL